MRIYKAKTTAIIITVLLMASVTLMAMPVQPVKAQISAVQPSISIPSGARAPNVTTKTVPYLSFRPNPIGLGQSLLVNAWLSPSLSNDRYFMSSVTGSFQVTLTKPDKTKEVIKMHNTLEDAASYFEYAVDQVGTWTIKFDFLGTYFPAGQYANGYMITNTSGTNYPEPVYYQPSSSAEYNITVQQDFVWSWPPSPLPNDYWTRPVDFSHREWWQIMGNWPGIGYQAADYGSFWDALYPGTSKVWVPRAEFTPWVQGPNSAHVVWKREMAIGGLMGGPAGYQGVLAAPDVPEVVYSGRCYTTVTKLTTQLLNGTYRTLPGSVAQCYDLRTGEVFYEIPTADGGVTPTYVVYNPPTGSAAIYGEVSFSSSYSIELVTISNGRLLKINPYTGAVSTNVSIDPLTGSGGTFINQMGGYVAAVQSIGNATNPNYRLINWTTVGTSTTFATRIISNTTYATSSIATLQDWNVGLGATVAGITEQGVRTGQNITGFNLYTGAKLWSTIIPEPQFSGSCAIADHGKVAILSMYGYYVALDLQAGKVAWTSEKMDYPWGATGFGVYGITSGYGLLFRCAYSGVYAFDWETGKIAWVFREYARAPFESPYTEYTEGREVYAGMVNMRIADGKAYIYNGEHTPTQPRTRGWSLWCINITTGEGIWDIAMGGNIMFGHDPSTGPIVDGYLIFPSTTGYNYIFGRGKSATTVTAPDVSVPLGTAFTIKGSVLDMSPAQPNTPCVSKDSMRTQMEYLHLQYPIGGIWGNETITGVPVSLTAIDENGTAIDLGSVTTNGYFGTFSKAWAPPKEGTYEIMAYFQSDDSYGSSKASTAVSVGPAPEPYPQQIGPAAVPDTIPYIVGTGIAIIIAVAIAALLSLRKR